MQRKKINDELANDRKDQNYLFLQSIAIAAVQLHFNTPNKFVNNVQQDRANEPNRDWLAQPNNVDKTRSATLLWIRSKISAVTSVWYGVSALRKLFLAIPSDMHEWTDEAKSENNSFLRSRKHHRDFGVNWTNNKFR